MTVPTTSYSDFLKEGALHEEPARKVFAPAPEVKPFRMIPEEKASEAEEQAFWKQLRHFFRTGEKPAGSNQGLVPALMAPYSKKDYNHPEFPFYLPEESTTCQVLSELLYETVNNLFGDNEANILRQNLQRLTRYFNEAIDEQIISFDAAKEQAISRLLDLDVRGEEGVKFKSQVEELRSALPVKGILTGFHPEIPLLFIRHHLEKMDGVRETFRGMVAEKRELLRNKLNQGIDRQRDNHNPDKEFELASGYIEWDKISEMLPAGGSIPMPEERLKRIEDIIQTLDRYLDSDDHLTHLVASEDLKEAFHWDKLFGDGRVTFAGTGDALQIARETFDTRIAEFTRFIVAVRKADLEIEDRYDASIHDEFYNHFKWLKLEQEEMNISPPVLLFLKSADLLDQGMSAFSKLLITNKPINIIAFSDLESGLPAWNDGSDESYLSYRQELAVNALSHRNAFIAQCTTDRPVALDKGIQSGLKSMAPALIHLLIPSKDEDPRASLLKVNAASAGRSFPDIIYDPHKGSEWGSRFDVTDNIQPENDWPVFPFTHLDYDQKELLNNLPFTYADYLAMFSEKANELLTVPESMVNEYLIPLDEFLSVSQTGQAGKIPFIWLADNENCMVRAALPYTWVTACMERLDFWNFIQETGGIRNYHVRI